MSAAAAIRDLITPLLGSGWSVQFGAWDDVDRTESVAVVRPVGGGLAELVRRPQFTLLLVGAESISATAIEAKANQIIEAMRASSAGLVSLQPGEPVFIPTSDRRPVFEIAVSAITT